MDSAGLGEPDTAWPGGLEPFPCFSEAPPSSPQLSVPVPGWGGGRETLSGINFTLWILLLSCLLPPGEGPALGPQLYSPVFSVHLTGSQQTV